MNPDIPANRFQAVVVGKKGEQFARYAAALLAQCQIDVVQCDDVYSAVAAMSRLKPARAVIIGSFGVLHTEDGRFLEKISEQGLLCCCLADSRTASTWMAEDEGFFIITQQQQLKDVIDKLALVPSPSQGRSSFGDGGSKSFKHRFRTTQAELNALLGLEETKP